LSKPWCTPLAGGVRIAVHIAPNAKRSEVLGVFDDALKIRLQAQPVEGRANDALIKFIAAKLGVARSSVTITHGHTNKRKLLEVGARDLAPERAERLLLGEA
jgi:uncharacterized protein (TIGR00251 family)